MALIKGRFLFLTLLCGNIEPWLAVCVCTLTGWGAGIETNLSKLCLAAGVAIAGPPWYAVIFEATGRAISGPPRHPTAIAAAGIMLAMLCAHERVWLPTFISGAAVLISLIDNRFSAALVCAAWTAGAASDINPTFLSIAAAPVFLSELSFNQKHNATRGKPDTYNNPVFDKNGK
jgi:hypothetical protein